jgi:hypothetical protein
MARRNAPFEIEEVKQLALIATLPTHHGKPPPLKFSEDGITVRQESRALFQRHRPSAEVELGSTWLIAGRFSSTPNFTISAVEVSSFAQ